jgi:hypothetical protein
VLGDADLRATLGQRGRATAAEFSWPVVAESVVGMYHRVVGDAQTGTHSSFTVY